MPPKKKKRPNSYRDPAMAKRAPTRKGKNSGGQVGTTSYVGVRPPKPKPKPPAGHGSQRRATTATSRKPKK